MEKVDFIKLKLEYMRELRQCVDSENLAGTSKESYAGKLKKVSDSLDKDLLDVDNRNGRTF